MNSLKILLAAMVIVLASNFLSGCATQTENISFQDYSDLGMARIDAARELKQSVQLVAKPLSDSGLDFELTLENPEKQAITSAELWLSYDPAVLSGASFEPNEKTFELEAPYENGFDELRGLLKMGRSTAHPVSDPSIVLGTVHFERLSDTSTLIDVYDYDRQFSGHASVNTMLDDQPVNLLLEPASPFVVIH